MANNQLLASDNFASGSLAAGWSPGFGSTKSSVTGGAPFYAEPPNTATTCDNAWTGLVWPNEQASEITVQTLTEENGTNLALWVRLQSGALSGYVVNIGTSLGTLTIFRCDAGAFTQLGSTVNGVTFASGDVLTFQASGALLTVYKNWQRIAWVSDATYVSGSPGFRQNSGVNITHTQVASWRGYSAIQQDGIWSKQGTVIPALAGDIGAGALGVYQLSNLLFEGNAQLLSGNVFKGWFSAGASPGSIFYAESLDGVNWTRKTAAVIASFANPFIIKNGATYNLYAQPAASQGSGSFALYTSTDGINWAQQSTTILAPGAGGSWDATNFFDFQPVAIINGTWYALYTGSASGAASLSTGLATSPDGLTWTKYAGNPVLPNIANNGAFAKVGNNYYLWAAANQPNQFSGTLNGFRPFEAVRYQTTDFINWTNPTHSAHRTQMFESLNFSLAGSGGAFPNSIINVNGKAYLYIQENPADGITPDIQQISLAIAPAPIELIVLQNEDAMPQTASDNFTRGAGTLGPNWTTPTGWTALQIIAGNLVEATVTNTICAGIFTGASFSNDQWSEITIQTDSVASGLCEPLVRAQAGSTNCYFVNLQGPTGTLNTSLQVFKNVSSVSTAIGPAVGITPQVGDKIRLSVVGNILSVFQNGFLLLQVQDYSNSIASGSPGMLLDTLAGTLVQVQVSGWAGGNANVIPSYSPSGGFAAQPIPPFQTNAGPGTNSSVILFGSNLGIEVHVTPQFPDPTNDSPSLPVFLGANPASPSVPSSINQYARPTLKETVTSTGIQFRNPA